MATHYRPLAAESGLELRRAERHDVAFASTLATAAGIGACHVVNLSTTGFMIRTETLVDNGAAVALTLPSIGPVAGRAIWCLGGRIGGAFDVAIPQVTFDRMLKGARLLPAPRIMV